MPYAAEAIRQLQSALAARAITGKRLMAYPNAGMPRIVGGCCGTGPDHIRTIRAIRAAFAAG